MTGTTSFSEVMAGPFRLTCEDRVRLHRLELTVPAPGLLRVWADAEAHCVGRAVSAAWADDASAVGTTRIAPLVARKIRNRCDFTAIDGRRRTHVDGWKSISFRHPLPSMTTLPVLVTDNDGLLVGRGVLHFDLRRDGGSFLAGFRDRSDAGPQRNHRRNLL
jgi:hypothetical protein